MTLRMASINSNDRVNGDSRHSPYGSNMDIKKRKRLRGLLFLMLAVVLCGSSAAGNDEFTRGRSVVLSAVHGVCMEIKHLGVNVETNRAEDFIAGQIHAGIGNAHRSIGYGIGIRFNNELPFKIDKSFKEIRYQVFKADDKKTG